MSNSKHAVAALATLLLSGILGSSGQEVALKTNLLFDAMTTPNVGVECNLDRTHSLQLVYGYNPWKFGDNREHFAKHWVLMPEFRWWTCTAFNGHFFGIHAMPGQFDAAKAHLPVPGAFFGGENLTSGVRHSRYEGTFAGIGATYGYQWSLSRHWNIEFEAGVGYNHVWYDKYKCGECGGKIKKGQTNYAGLTKLGVSILYLF